MTAVETLTREHDDRDKLQRIFSQLNDYDIIMNIDTTISLDRSIKQKKIEIYYVCNYTFRYKRNQFKQFFLS